MSRAFSDLFYFSRTNSELLPPSLRWRRDCKNMSTETFSDSFHICGHCLYGRLISRFRLHLCILVFAAGVNQTCVFHHCCDKNKNSLPPFTILRDHRGFFIKRKLRFGCHQSYHIWCVVKTSLVGLANIVYRPQHILRKMFSLSQS